jgi:hypothetical protein
MVSLGLRLPPDRADRSRPTSTSHSRLLENQQSTPPTDRPCSLSDGCWHTTASWLSACSPTVLAGLCCNRPVGTRAGAVAGLNGLALLWRAVLTVAGIALLLNGSLRMSDDVWPFGPMSQYAFSPTADATIVITRVEGMLADGRRIDLPLRPEAVGIGRAEIEAQIPAIQADPSLLRAVVSGWSRNHPEPRLRQVWLVQDVTRLEDGRRGPTELVEIASWVVRP